jgi:hypothetical protein
LSRSASTSHTNNAEAIEEINSVRTGLVKNRTTYIKNSPQQNGNGITWKRLIDRAETEKNVLYKYLGGKALFTGMLRLYAALHKEMKDSLVLDNTKREEEDAPRSRRQKRKSDFDDGSNNNKKEETEKSRPLPVPKNRGHW